MPLSDYEQNELILVAALSFKPGPGFKPKRSIQKKVRAGIRMNKSSETWEPAIEPLLCWWWMEAWFPYISSNLPAASRSIGYYKVVRNKCCNLAAWDFGNIQEIVVFQDSSFNDLPARLRVTLQLLAPNNCTIPSGKHKKWERCKGLPI